MKTKRKSPAKKEYRVIAESSRFVYQNVMARNPEEAQRIASDNRDGWDTEMDCEDGDYRLLDNVEDLESGELVPVAKARATHCKTCGTELDAWSLGMPLEAAVDHELAAVRERAELKRTLDRYPTLRAEEKIRLAFKILWDVHKQWDEDNLIHYPDGLPSFDEYIAEISNPLYDISWK